VPRPFSGLVFDRNDPEVLIVGGHAQRLTASLFAVQVARDARGHVIGFAPARRIAAVPFADGGLAHGPQGALLYTRYPNAELGQLRPGDSTPDRVVKLPGKSCGGFAIVPAGLPGAGRAKLLAWPGGEWSDAELTADAQGVGLGAPQQIATLSGGPDGFVYVAAGTPCFLRPGVLVAEWSSHTIAAYDVDGNGDPIVETRPRRRHRVPGRARPRGRPRVGRRARVDVARRRHRDARRTAASRPLTERRRCRGWQGRKKRAVDAQMPRLG
jgi:hypothetical protein